METDASSGPPPPRRIRSAIGTAISAHWFPVVVTTVFIGGGWTMITLPLVAIFIIDKAFKANEYLAFILYAFGVGAGVSVLIMLPVALLLDALTAKSKLALAAPVLMAAAAAILVVARILITRQILNVVFGWAGAVLALCLIFAVYWTALWGWRLVHHLLGKYTRQRRLV